MLDARPQKWTRGNGMVTVPSYLLATYAINSVTRFYKMSALVEIDEIRRHALEKFARRRKTSVRRVLERAVDEFIERADDEELLTQSSIQARRTHLRESDASFAVREWRNKRALKKRRR